MTLAQSSDSAHRSSGSARVSLDRLHHNANDDTANMSSAGPEKSPPVTSGDGTDVPANLPDYTVYDASTQTLADDEPPGFSWHTTGQPVDTRVPETTTLKRLCIQDLTQQLRHERYLEERVQILKRRKRILHQTISLSARLHRLQSVVRDGLIEISARQDPAIPFKKLLQHTHDLVDVCYARWNLQLHALDPLETPEYTLSVTEPPIPVGPQLSSSAQSSLLLLLNYLRSNPVYLVRRITALSFPQLQSLLTVPRSEKRNTTAFSSLQNSTRMSQHQQLQNLSKTLQEHTISFERANPWSLLLFNVYGTDTSLHSPENLLRISTWSTVLADLYVSHEPAFRALAPMLLDSFASLHDWHIKEGMQLQLMDFLQQGAFLLDTNRADTNRTPGQVLTNHSDTPDARNFFSEAVLDLLFLFYNNNGGFPPGAMQFICAILAKLPTQEHQSAFRGYCLSDWFIDRFLRNVIAFPENENMLLNFHISPAARKQLLQPLFNALRDAVHGVWAPNPLQPVSPGVQYFVFGIVDALNTIPVDNAYPIKEQAPAMSTQNVSISVCVSEVIQLLDALSPQVMHNSSHLKHFVESLTESFQVQYSQDRFNRLRQELLSVQEPGSSVTNIHPCDEQWMEFRIDEAGQLARMPELDHATALGNDWESCDLDPVQQASLKLSSNLIATSSFGSTTSYRTNRRGNSSLKSLLHGIINSPDARTNPVSQIFWQSALTTLSEKYPKCMLTEDDSSILRPLVNRSKTLQSLHVSDCAELEADISALEDVSSKIRHAITTSVDRLEDLKIKIWYSTYVVTSKPYEDAKNVCKALVNMALLTAANASTRTTPMPSMSRPSSSRSTTSSAWSHPVDATLGILKARAEHGGPKKLSDEQVVLTESWLRETVIENFCTGEERIHRFCMEVSSTSKAIISESSDRSASPVLWCNVLFSNEQAYYSLNNIGISSAPASTRPASVSSETYLYNSRPTRPVLRNNQTARSILRTERLSPVRRSSGHGSWTTRLDRELPPTETLFSVGSPGRAYSTTTAESISTFWSPLPSNPRSLTSASIYSRPASMFNEGHNRLYDTLHENTEFLDSLRHKLVCLLLSDLGCVVWSRGSETDSWLTAVRDNAEVSKILSQWQTRERLYGLRSGRTGVAAKNRPAVQRRESVSVPRNRASIDKVSDSFGTQEDNDQQGSNYEIALQDLLVQMRSHVDPKSKLQAVEDFYSISLAQIQLANQAKSSTRRGPGKRSVHRRHSLGASDFGSHANGASTQEETASQMDEPPTDAEITSRLKANLILLKPSTLFRDLQYIAALVPHELSNRTPRGEAVIRLGVAALAYKEDVCWSMVAVADKLVSKDAVKRPMSVDPPEATIRQAADFWMIAALEGNAVAQRELGLLYLSHPHAIPILTYPLTVASKVFQHETQWPDTSQPNASKSSLCLAMHWVKLAAANGDEVARHKLAERAERAASISFR